MMDFFSLKKGSMFSRSRGVFSSNNYDFLAPKKGVVALSL